jgi:alkylation response protein AidB-like acyl-CoA dehydrogenase
MHSPGIEVRPIKQINGASGFNEVFFTSVRVPDSQRISEVGNGWAVSITTLMNERAAVGGAAGLGFDDLVRLAKGLDLDGRPAYEDSSVRQRLSALFDISSRLALILSGLGSAECRSAYPVGRRPWDVHGRLEPRARFETRGSGSAVCCRSGEVAPT